MQRNLWYRRRLASKRVSCRRMQCGCSTNCCVLTFVFLHYECGICHERGVIRCLLTCGSEARGGGVRIVLHTQELGYGVGVVAAALVWGRRVGEE